MTVDVRDDPTMMAHPGPELQLRSLRREARVRAIVALGWLAVVIACCVAAWQMQTFGPPFVIVIVAMVAGGVILGMHLKALIEIRGAMWEAQMDQLEDDIKRREVEE